MRFTANELNTVLRYIKTHAENGVLALDSYAAVADETGLKTGKTAAVFYFLCGEGIILQEGNTVLLLEETEYPDSAEI